VHCAADGIGLGAAIASGANLETIVITDFFSDSRSTLDRTSLGFIVFLAIILHKAPSAFGFATFLLSEGHTRRSVRQHLLAFSCSAPVSAILTYGILHSTVAIDSSSDTPPSSSAEFEMRKWTGILLLFSSGTFLYVATVHILPEIYAPSRHYRHVRGSSANGILLGSLRDDDSHRHDWHEHDGEKTLSRAQMAMWVLGMITPFVLAVEVSTDVAK
jgi:solute carrier family 39 (zinc transporter), member 9